MQATARTWLTLALALAPCTLVTAALQAQEGPLPERHVRWLDEVSVLLSAEERQAFQKIEETYRREAFIEDFWRVRDPHPQSPHNEFRDAWETRL